MQTQPGTNGNAPQKKRSAVNGSSTVEIKREEAEEVAGNFTLLLTARVRLFNLKITHQ